MQSKDSLVSIIVPVYGTEEYLPRCIESIIAQSYSNIQLVLVDDQSPDKCPEICDYYAQSDTRIMVIHQENKGVSGARNTGICHSNGDYIMFVDSDDELYPKAVEILLRDAKAFDADIVSATKRVISENGRIISLYENGDCCVLQDEEPLLLSLEGERNANSVCAKLFKTSFLQDVNFEEGQNINEDGFFIFQCYMKRPVLVQRNMSVYQYNVRRGSNSRQIFSDKHLSMLYFCNRKKQLIAEQYPQYTQQVHSMEVRTNLQILDLLCSTTEKKYKKLQTKCVKTVRDLRQYHQPINNHHKRLSWIVVHGLYPLYKIAVRFKHYR